MAPAFINSGFSSLALSTPIAQARVCAAPRSTFIAPISFRKVSAPKAAPAQTPIKMEFEISEGSAFELNPVVIIIALIGWMVPSSLPSGLPILKGAGITPAFIATIQDNLSRWPTGPALSDPFWGLMVSWHLGMFAVLLFGTIGYNGRKQGYF